MANIVIKISPADHLIVQKRFDTSSVKIRYWVVDFNGLPLYMIF